MTPIAEEVVPALVLEIARRKNPALAGLHLDQPLVAGLGLRSLDLAEIVAVLEQRFGFDPFAESVSITSIRTVRDLCEAYRTALPEERADLAALQSVKERAERRRRK